MHLWGFREHTKLALSAMLKEVMACSAPDALARHRIAFSTDSAFTETRAAQEWRSIVLFYSC